jgi:Mn2+/Fe2+ NRAMP family transporter
MFTIMLLATRTSIMGQFTVSRGQRWLGWIATAIMAFVSVTMFVLA